MKGLLIGMFNATKGLYQLLVTLLVVPIYNSGAFMPFLSSHELWVLLLPGEYSSGSDCCAGVRVGWVAKRYRYRERDEALQIY